jgi:hypothetical protein
VHNAATSEEAAKLHMMMAGCKERGGGCVGLNHLWGVLCNRSVGLLNEQELGETELNSQGGRPHWASLGAVRVG